MADWLDPATTREAIAESKTATAPAALVFADAFYDALDNAECHTPEPIGGDAVASAAKRATAVVAALRDANALTAAGAIVAAKHGLADDDRDDATG